MIQSLAKKIQGIFNMHDDYDNNANRLPYNTITCVNINVNNLHRKKYKFFVDTYLNCPKLIYNYCNNGMFTPLSAAHY